MTRTLRDLGLSRSLVRRPYIIENARRPLPIETTRGPSLYTNFISTPYELARLMVAVHRGAIGRGGVARIGIGAAAARAELLARFLDVRDTTKLVAGLPSGVPVAHKTGYTDQVRHDAGIIYLRSGPVAAAAMAWSASGVGGTGERFIARVATAARSPARRRRRLRRPPPDAARRAELSPAVAGMRLLSSRPSGRGPCATIGG